MALNPTAVVVLTTAPKGKGAEIARKLVEERLAACVNIAEVHSIYWWKSRIESDEEELLIVKTRIEKLPELVKRLREIHPYEVPEVIVLPVLTGYREYIDWLVSETEAREAKDK